MGSRSHHQHRKTPGLLTSLWEAFWYPPESHCPKCRGVAVEYYDPFFFSPLRALKGRRRIKCMTCGFIWRPSRKSRSLLDDLRWRL